MAPAHTTTRGDRASYVQQGKELVAAAPNDDVRLAADAGRSGAAGAAGAGQRLLEAGTRWVFVSLGPEGIWAGSAEESFVLPAERATVVNVTGAGDAFTAGIAWGIATGATLRETARIASGLAALTVESERTVSDRVSAEALRERTVQP